VDLTELLARRRMTRSFRGDAVDQDLLDSLCAEALRAPTAGNCAGVRMSTVARDLVGQYVAVATDPQWRATNRRYEGLARAGAVVIVTSRPQDYLTRYAKDDKASSGLEHRENWNVPYWHTDAAMATMALLLLLEERSLGATLWGNFRHDADVMEWAQIDEEELFATVLVGVGDAADHRSTSLEYPVPPRSQRVRRIEGTLGQG
jgi:nitroreductase